MLGQLFSYTKTEYSIPGLSFVLGAVLVLMVVVVVSIAVSWCYQQISIMKALDADNHQHRDQALIQYRINGAVNTAAAAGGPPPPISNYVLNNPGHHHDPHQLPAAAAVSSSMIALSSTGVVSPPAARLPDQYLHHQAQLVVPPPPSSSSLSLPSPAPSSPQAALAGVAAEAGSQDPSCDCARHTTVEMFVSVLMPGDQIPSFMARPINKEEEFEYAPHLTKDTKLTCMHE